MARQLVPDNSRIFEIGLRPVKNMQISAADAGTADAHEDLTRLRRRFGSLDDFERPWTLAEERSHRA